MQKRKRSTSNIENQGVDDSLSANSSWEGVCTPPIMANTERLDTPAAQPILIVQMYDKPRGSNGKFQEIKDGNYIRVDRRKGKQVKLVVRVAPGPDALVARSILKDVVSKTSNRVLRITLEKASPGARLDGKFIVASITPSEKGDIINVFGKIDAVGHCVVSARVRERGRGGDVFASGRSTSIVCHNNGKQSHVAATQGAQVRRKAGTATADGLPSRSSRARDVIKAHTAATHASSKPIVGVHGPTPTATAIAFPTTTTATTTTSFLSDPSEVRRKRRRTVLELPETEPCSTAPFDAGEYTRSFKKWAYRAAASPSLDARVNMLVSSPPGHHVHHEQQSSQQERPPSHQPPAVYPFTRQSSAMTSVTKATTIAPRHLTYPTQMPSLSSSSPGRSLCSSDLVNYHSCDSRLNAMPSSEDLDPFPSADCDSDILTSPQIDPNELLAEPADSDWLFEVRVEGGVEAGAPYSDIPYC